MIFDFERKKRAGGFDASKLFLHNFFIIRRYRFFQEKKPIVQTIFIFLPKNDRGGKLLKGPFPEIYTI